MTSNCTQSAMSKKILSTNLNKMSKKMSKDLGKSLII